MNAHDVAIFSIRPGIATQMLVIVVAAIGGASLFAAAHAFLGYREIALSRIAFSIPVWVALGVWFLNQNRIVFAADRVSFWWTERYMPRSFSVPYQDLERVTTKLSGTHWLVCKVNSGADVSVALPLFQNRQLEKVRKELSARGVEVEGL